MTNIIVVSLATSAFLFLIIVKKIYNYVFIKGEFKVPIGEYSIRRIKFNFDDKTVNELREVAVSAVNIVPGNTFFNGQNLHNKIALIVYHKNKPVGFNVMFEYKCENMYCLHVGLVLIDRNFKGKRLQQLTKYNIVLYLIESFFKNIYLSNIGRSASGLQLFNLDVKKSYPNLIYKNNCTTDYKKIFNYFIDNFKEAVQISSNSSGNDETFIIKKAYDSQSGAKYLLNFEDTRQSKNQIYNDYINSIDKEDIILSIGKVNVLSILGS